MRAYIVYSAYCGPEEGCLLVFANTVQEARKISYPVAVMWGVDEWTDHTARWLRDEHVFLLGNQTKLTKNIPHVIDNPPCCDSCSHWGCEVHEGGICSYCGEPVGDTLVSIYLKQKSEMTRDEYEKEYLGEFN